RLYAPMPSHRATSCLVSRPRPPPALPLFPYTTLFRSPRVTAALGGPPDDAVAPALRQLGEMAAVAVPADEQRHSLPATAAISPRDRKSTRLNSSHEWISYAVFCLKKKKTRKQSRHDVP